MIKDKLRASGMVLMGAVFSLALAVAPAQATEEKKDEKTATVPVKLLDFTTAAPANWESLPPTSSFRLAQFKIPGAPAKPGADLVIYYFGAGQGGPVDANIARWTGQFTSADGKPVTPKIDKFKVGNLPVTTAELTGNYARGVGMGAQDAVLPDHTLLAAIVETPKGNLTFQLYGPTSAVAASKDAMLNMVKSLK